MATTASLTDLRERAAASAAAKAADPNAPDPKDVEQKKLATMKPKEQIAYLLQQRRGEIAKMLPKHLTIDRLLKVAMIAATTTPQLAECDVKSLVVAVGNCALLGLEPNTPLGHAYLVPFNTKRKDAQGRERWVKSVQVIIGYKGLIDLARRSGQIVSIAAHEVCTGDEFEMCYGLVEKLHHKPALGDRGEVIGFYAVAHLVGGGHAFEWMSRQQVEWIRNNSQNYAGAKNKDTTVWATHFIEMGRKTAIRRLAKYLPLSIELATAIAMDDLAARGGDQELATIDGEFMHVPSDDDGDGAGGNGDGGQGGGDAGAGAGADAGAGGPSLEHQPATTVPPIVGSEGEKQPAGNSGNAGGENLFGPVE